MPSVSRRTVIVAGAAGAGALAVAACSPGGGAAVAGKTPTAPAGHALISLTSVPVGGCVSVKLPGGAPAIVSHPTADTVVCFSAICTHLGCTVNPDGTQLVCPCHGSVYDAATGQVRQGPAPSPLPAVPVHVAGGEVVTGPSV